MERSSITISELKMKQEDENITCMDHVKASDDWLSDDGDGDVRIVDKASWDASLEEALRWPSAS